MPMMPLDTTATLDEAFALSQFQTILDEAEHQLGTHKPDIDQMPTVFDDQIMKLIDAVPVE